MTQSTSFQTFIAYNGLHILLNKWNQGAFLYRQKLLGTVGFKSWLLPYLEKPRS